jgi:hypothetical protein
MNRAFELGRHEVVLERNEIGTVGWCVMKHGVLLGKDAVAPMCVAPRRRATRSTVKQC